MSKTILITGATGNVASNILPHLAGKDVTVRALVRDPAKAAKLGVETVQGDLEYHHALPKAFAGADTVVIIHPPGPRAPAQSSNALWAAKQAGVKRVVRLSAIGAGYDAPTINGRMHTIIKPHFFLQNMLGNAPQIAKDGKFFYAMGDGKVPMIDVRDIGEFFARVLLSDGHDGKTYTLTGPSAVTLHDFAAAVSRATGKPVEYVPVPVEAAVQGMKQWGMDDWMVGMMVDYMNAYARNWASDVTSDFQQVVGRPARSIDEFARDFAGAFKG